MNIITGFEKDWNLAVRIISLYRSQPQKLPASRGVERIDSRLGTADSDTSCRNLNTRICKSWCVDPFVQSPKIRKSRKESEHVDQIVFTAVDINYFLSRKIGMHCDIFQVRSIFATVADRNIKDP